MSYYVKLDKSVIAVGILNQVVIAPFSCRGEDMALIVVENTSVTETFSGYVWSSPNGNSQWVVEPTDEFVSIGPGITRRLLLPPDRIWLRLMGLFNAQPDNVRVSLYLMHNVTWFPSTFGA